jgi:hypothetical protein
MPSKPPRGRPTTNSADRIPASPQQIAKAIFKAAEKKGKAKGKPKPN